MTEFKSGDRVKLLSKSGKLLGIGKISRCEERAISIHHDDGAVTMLQGRNDPFFVWSP